MSEAAVQPEDLMDHTEDEAAAPMEEGEDTVCISSQELFSSQDCCTPEDQIQKTPDITECPKAPNKQIVHVASTPVPDCSSSRYLKDYDVIEELGQGICSVVNKVLNRFDGCFYALKCRSCNGCPSSWRDKGLNEVQALAAIGFHKNIVKYYTAWEEEHPPCLYVQLELCSNNLRRSKIHWLLCPERSLLNIIYKIAGALNFIHDHGIVHLDVKPDNIYILDGDFKLGGFCHAARIGSTTNTQELDGRYMPTEILKETYKNNVKIDIFSLGATVYELARGHDISSSEVLSQLFRQEKDKYLTRFSEPFKDLLESMMDSTPSKRPTAADILMNSIFKNKND